MKKVLCVVLSFILCFPIVPVFAENTPFSDVTGVEMERKTGLLSALGIVSGYEDGTFRGERLVTRAEMAVLISKALGFDDKSEDVKERMSIFGSFADVPEDHWGVGGIYIAYLKKIISGYGDGMFLPDKNVTFQEAVKMLVVALGYNLKIDEENAWPQGYLNMAEEAGITEGIEHNPEDYCDRNTIVKLLYNSLHIQSLDKCMCGEILECDVWITESLHIYVIKDIDTFEYNEETNTVKVSGKKIELNSENPVDTEIKLGENVIIPEGEIYRLYVLREDSAEKTETIIYIMQ